MTKLSELNVNKNYTDDELKQLDVKFKMGRFNFIFLKEGSHYRLSILDERHDPYWVDTDPNFSCFDWASFYENNFDKLNIEYVFMIIRDIQKLYRLQIFL